MTDTPKTQDAADWSDLPRDMYVVRAWKPDGLFWCAEVAQVPHALAPEVRYVRAIPLPADDAPTEASYSEGFNFTDEQLQAMGEAWAPAWAEAKAEQDADDAEMVERVARAICKSGKFETGEGVCAMICMDSLGDIRKKGCGHCARVHGTLAHAVLSAMRGEP